MFQKYLFSFTSLSWNNNSIFEFLVNKKEQFSHLRYKLSIGIITKNYVEKILNVRYGRLSPWVNTFKDQRDLYPDTVIELSISAASIPYINYLH